MTIEYSFLSILLLNLEIIMSNYKLRASIIRIRPF